MIVVRRCFWDQDEKGALHLNLSCLMSRSVKHRDPTSHEWRRDRRVMALTLPRNPLFWSCPRQLFTLSFVAVQGNGWGNGRSRSEGWLKV